MSDLRTAIARALVEKAKPILTTRWNEHISTFQDDPSMIMGRVDVSSNQESQLKVEMTQEEFQKLMKSMFFKGFQKGYWTGVVDSIDVGFDMGQSAESPVDKLK